MSWLLFVAAAAALTASAQDRGYTFGTTVVSNSWLQGKVYHLAPRSEKLPDFKKLSAQGVIYANRLEVWPQDFSEGFPGITERFEWFAIDYTGRFWVEKPGVYRFSLLSDDGAMLEVDGKEVIDNDRKHMATAVSGSAHLTRGVHTLRVSYYQGPRFHVALVFALAPPGERWRTFDTEDFPPPKDPAEWVNGRIGQIRKGLTPGR